jgi:hypothetical protein
VNEEPQINQLIHKSLTVAFEAGRHAERDYLRRALDLNATSNEIGRYIYLDDFEDAIRELDAERQETKLS